MLNQTHTKGFTLIELAIVLGVIAALAGILTPMVVGYVDQARGVRASADTRAIATVILAYKRDTSFFPIYEDFSDAQSDNAAGEVLAGAGKIPQFGAGWTAALLMLDLDAFLNTNKLGLTTSGAAGARSYRGPYLDIAPDPWGNAYLATAYSLTRVASDHAYAISAGPNGTLETAFAQPKSGPFSAGGDDIVRRIQ